jgi:tripartite-type tricarboxylate transporter receptor subunit TctC
MKCFRVFVIVVFGWALVAPAAFAFPDRPITLVNSFAPGGPADVFARLMAQAMGEQLQQNVIVANRTGGGGSIGANSVAKAAPDGYTLMFAMPSTHAILPYVMAKLPYDPVKDFVPVSMVSTLDYVLAINPAIKANTYAEFVALVRQNPGKFSFGSAGTGSETHLFGEMFRTKAGVDVVHVPYRGTGPALTAVVSGEVGFMFAPMTAVLPFSAGGQLRPIATIANARSNLLPNVPTIAEAGQPEFVLKSWMAIFAPAGTPAPVVAKLNEAIGRVLRGEKMRARFTELGAAAVGSSSDELRNFLRQELVKYQALVSVSGVKTE